MNFFAVLMLACSLGLFADTARAQEARLVGDADASSEATTAPRTPTLVLVNETVKPTLDTKAGAQPKPSVAKSTTAKAAPTPTMAAAQPIVLSGAPATTTVESIAETTGNPK